jgi:DNA helicase IV
VLTPRQAKGLEFDHVVVVEPALIAEREQGLRHLYVALTRPTKTLVVLHARKLPM